ncbi:MAG: helix-turn-helix domain-containing protein [Deltaproteobacteria bacterium]|nr:helix-turn-helix domain-containing protein [Deltaproteobacteria bacterium]
MKKHDSKERMLELGKKIRKDRKSLGWTLEYFSNKLNISKMTLQRIETGQVSPSVSLLVEIAHQLNKPVSSYVRDKVEEVILLKKEDQKPYMERKLSGKTILPYGVISSGAEIGILNGKKGEVVEDLQSDSFIFRHVLEGKINLKYDEKTFEIGSGDGIYYDGRIPHTLEFLEDSVVITCLFKKQ